MVKPSDFTRANSDINGNSRFVCHYLNLNSDIEASVIMGWNSKGLLVNDKYAQALKRAKQLGGKKYHNKKYGGGIVFQCVEGLLPDLCKRLNALLNIEVTA